MRQPNQPLIPGQTLHDVPLIIGGVSVGTCDVFLDPETVEADRLLAMMYALSVINGQGAHPIVTIDTPGTRPNQVHGQPFRRDPELQALGLNSRYCRMFLDTSDGRPTPLLEEDHFRLADERIGSRAYRAITRIDDNSFYANELQAYFVRDSRKKTAGLNALRYGKLVDRLEVIHPGIHRLGSRALQACNTLRDRLYLDNK